MAKRKVISLGGKKFFSMVVLSVAVLGLMATTFALQKPTNTESEATGDNYGSLSNCNIANGWAGGIQLYNGINKNGGYRIMCTPIPNSANKIEDWADNNLDKKYFSGSLMDIWNFNNKTSSVRIRANPGCKSTVYLDDLKDGFGQRLGQVTADARYSNSAVFNFKNLNSEYRNKATSLFIRTICVKNPRGDTY